MDREPLVSVIVPVYGVEKYIAKCLDSIVNQKYKNIEVIVINDGTKDRSAEVAREYAANDSRVRVYDFENSGISVARNRGLKLAKSEYISYVDSDDWLDVNTYADLIPRMTKDNIDMVKFGFVEAYEEKQQKCTFKEQRIFHGTSAFDKYFAGILYTVVWNAIYRKDLADKVLFPENVVHEDNYSSGMYLYLVNKLLIVPECYYHYRVNINGISKSGVKRPLDKILAISKLIDNLKALGFESKKLSWKLACEYYHFIRGWNDAYKVVWIEKNLKEWIVRNLDFRRKFSFLLLSLKNGIKIY